MRPDLDIIQNWIAPGSRVLDLGCGDGSLLEFLKTNKGVSEIGLEIAEANITACLAKGVNVIEQDLNKSLKNFKDKSFDTVLLTQTLQAVSYPDVIIDEMLRMIDALQFTEEHGEVCPAGWNKGDTGMKATPDGVASYLADNADKL